MVTIYDLLEVSENASKEEIEKSYQKLVIEYQINPNLTDLENKENEMILNKLKIAYGIVMDDEKRKRYNNDLAQKRAEKLIKEVAISDDNENEDNNKIEEDKKEEDKRFYEEEIANEEILTREEKNAAIKAAQKQFKENLKKAQKIEEEYKQAYNKAYNDYLKKVGLKSQGSLTLSKIKITLITIVVIVVICAIAWNIPPIKRILVSLYEENFIIKSLVDIFSIFLKAIIGIFKK